MSTPSPEDDWRPGADHVALTRRAGLLAALRTFMHERGVLEVDTPSLVSAAPSERGLDSFAVCDAGYLTPSPEHAMKRLLAAAAGPIYQLGHVFRHGEIGRWHNPEFCMLEWYRPGADMNAIIDEMADLLTQTVGAPPVRCMDYGELFQARLGVDPLEASSRDLAAIARAHDVAPGSAAGAEGRAFWLDLLMSVVIQPTLGHEAPLCVQGFPADDAVLVASEPQEPRISRRFEFYWRGIELANGAEELCDAVTARQRMLRERVARAAAGRSEGSTDERLLAALDHGLPACAGVALGVDRLLALCMHAGDLAQVMPFDWSRR